MQFTCRYLVGGRCERNTQLQQRIDNLPNNQQYSDAERQELEESIKVSMRRIPTYNSNGTCQVANSSSGQKNCSGAS